MLRHIYTNSRDIKKKMLQTKQTGSCHDKKTAQRELKGTQNDPLDFE